MTLILARSDKNQVGLNVWLALKETKLIKNVREESLITSRHQLLVDARENAYSIGLLYVISNEINMVHEKRKKHLLKHDSSNSLF